MGGVAAAALAGVTLLPQTGWLVRQQVQAVFTGPVSLAGLETVNQRALERQEAEAAAHPANFPLQMALATRRNTSKSTAGTVNERKLAALQTLKADYPDQPSLLAAILRTLSQDTVNLSGRHDQYELQPPTEGAPKEKPVVPIPPAALAVWEDAAQTGARLDPGNAFFPLMQAIGLFARHKDAEALAQIKLAGTLPRYNDYGRDEATGGWDLLEAGQGGRAATLQRMSISAATLLPHDAVIRAAARLTTVQAMHLEQAGNTEEGFAVRQALLRCGARMRTDSTWIIGNLVGNTIAGIAEARPGGAPAIPRSVKYNARAALRFKNYEAYLTQINHPEEIAWMEHENDANKEVRSIANVGLSRGPSSIWNLVALMALWGGGVALLGNMLWMVLFGAIASRLRRTASIRNGEPLPRPVAWGLGLSVVPVGLVGAQTLSGGVDCDIAVRLVAAAALAVLVATPCFLRRGRQSQPTSIASIRQSAALMIATVAGMTLLLGLLLWTSGSIGGYASTLNWIIGIKPGESDPNGTIMRLLSLGLLTGLPLLTMITLAIRSRFRRVPVSVGVVRGLARVSLPLAALLSLGYVVVVGVTSVREAEARTALTATVQHEGRACARFVGRPWPGFAP